MPLPKIIAQEFELTLPSNGKVIKYRPFLVKEEKILLLARESKDRKTITNAIKQLLKACIITRGIKVEELPSFDIEYIFLNVRAKSVGEGIDLIVTCEDDGVTQVPVTIYIDEIQVHKDPSHTTDIDLGNNLILKMRYPSLTEFINTNFNMNSQENSEDKLSSEKVENSFEIISSCMDVIFNGDQVWAAKDCTKAELFSFIECMTTKQYKQIENFFNTMPTLKHEFEVINPKTEKKNKVILEGLTSFFT